jgi:hypothetical protein
MYKIWVEKYDIEEANKRMDFYRKKLSESLKNSKNVNNSKENNPMYNRTIYEVWVEKYGIEEANKRKSQWQNNLSGKKLYHNVVLKKQKNLKKEEIETYLNNGWSIGELKIK